MIRTKKKWLVSFLALTLFAAACGDDPVDEDDEPEVATLRLVVGAQTVNVNAVNGAVTGGPITLAINTDAPITATFLRADGSADPLVTATTFRLDVAPANANVAFTRTGPFGGTLRGTVAGNTSVNVALFHLGEAHEEFDFDVPVTVAGAQ